MDIVHFSPTDDNQINSSGVWEHTNGRDFVDTATGEKLPQAASEERTSEPFSERGASQRGAADGNPPVSNTGVHASLGQAAVSPDYLTIVPHVGMSELMPTLEALGLAELEKLEGGSRFCQEVYTGLHGLRIEALPRDETQNYCIVTLPGECCNWLGVDGFANLQFHFWILQQETEAKINITRFDVAIDTQAFPAKWVASALREGAIERRSETFDVHESTNGGCTVYLGSPTSDKRWRVYHKMDGSTFGEGVHFTRVEQQFRREAAAAAYYRFMGRAIDEWGVLAAEFLNDYATINKRWWRAFVGTVKRALLVVHRTRSTIEKKKLWLEKQVAPTLATVMDALAVIEPVRGRQWFEDILEDGRRRRGRLDAHRVRTNQEDELPRLAATWHTFASI